jgi:DNA-binding GntR family transcriptional regulator
MPSLLPPRETAGNVLLRESAHAVLRAEILNCELPPGAEIREAELAARFHVSKSPIRDALMRLESEGLVISMPRQGYRVASISPTDVDDMFQLRIALERACMERIIRHASDEQLAELDQFRHFDPAQWNQNFVAYNRAFHHMLAALSANPRMRDQLVDLIDQMERAVRVSVSHLKRGNPESLVAQHSELIDALQQRRVKRAERCAEKHVTAAAKRVSNAMARLRVII